MYGAYVQSMALLYNYLFNDDRYAKPGALTFQFWSYFWGGQPKRFEYDQNSLNDHIYWQMVESGYLGVACEPNCIFQICNQPAILGFRMHDLVNGGSSAEEVTRGYEQAWKDFGRIGDNGHYHIMISEDAKTVRQNMGRAPWVDAWVGALMNMWNRDFVHQHYPRQISDLVKAGENGALSINVPARPEIMGQRIVTDDCDFRLGLGVDIGDGRCRAIARIARPRRPIHAPAWREGGLYYPRNDRIEDANGNRTLIEPMSGNVLLGYARLNIPDGLWRLYNEPWSKAHFEEPAITEVSSDIDIGRAVFDPKVNKLEMIVERRDDIAGDGSIRLSRALSRGRWSMICEDIEIAHGAAGDVVVTGPLNVSIEKNYLVIRVPRGFRIRAPWRSRQGSRSDERGRITTGVADRRLFRSGRSSWSPGNRRRLSGALCSDLLWLYELPGCVPARADQAVGCAGFTRSARRSHSAALHYGRSGSGHAGGHAGVPAVLSPLRRPNRLERADRSGQVRIPCICSADQRSRRFRWRYDPSHGDRLRNGARWQVCKPFY